MAEINAQIPLSYVFGPTIGDHFKAAVSIADARDAMRSRGMQRAQAQQEMQKTAYAMQLEREKQAREAAMRGVYAEELNKFNQPEAPVDVQKGILYPRSSSGFGLDMGNVPIAQNIPNYQPKQVPPQLPMNKDMIRQFQKEQGIGVDGIIGPITQRKLEEAYKQEGGSGVPEFGLPKTNQGMLSMPDSGYPQSMIEEQKIITEKVTPEKKLPKEYEWMGPDFYKKYLNIAKIDPAIGEKMLIDAVAKRKGLAAIAAGLTQERWETMGIDAGKIEAMPAVTPEEIQEKNDAWELYFKKYSPSTFTSLPRVAAQKAKEVGEATGETRRKEEQLAIDLKELQLKIQDQNLSSQLDLLDITKKQFELDDIKDSKEGKEYNLARIRGTIDELSNFDEDKMAVGMNLWAQGKSFVPGTEEYKFATKHSYLINMIKLAARGALRGTGTVSDFEQKMLGAASTELRRGTDLKTYKETLDRMSKYYEWKQNNKRAITSGDEMMKVLGFSSISGGSGKNGGSSSGGSKKGGGF